MGAEGASPEAPVPTCWQPRSPRPGRHQHPQGGLWDSNDVGVFFVDTLFYFLLSDDDVWGLLQVFSDQLLLKDVLARSDRALAVVKDLFGDAPHVHTGRNPLFNSQLLKLSSWIFGVRICFCRAPQCDSGTICASEVRTSCPTVSDESAGLSMSRYSHMCCTLICFSGTFFSSGS